MVVAPQKLGVMYNLGSFLVNLADKKRKYLCKSIYYIRTIKQKRFNKKL